MIVNESFVKKYFAGRDPIGMHTGFGGDPGTKTDMTVIGVVKDIKYTNLRDEIPVQAFVPYLASRDTAEMTVYVRTAMDPEQLLSVIQRKIHALDPNVPMYETRSTEEELALSLRTERLVANLSSVFGGLATLLAITGLYGVMAYTVARRTREIGIRMALGAIRGNVIWMVMREVLVLVGAGVLFGVPISHRIDLSGEKPALRPCAARSGNSNGRHNTFRPGSVPGGIRARLARQSNRTGAGTSV